MSLPRDETWLWKWNEMDEVLGHLCANSNPGGLMSSRYLSVTKAIPTILLQSLRVRGEEILETTYFVSLKLKDQSGNAASAQISRQNTLYYYYLKWPTYCWISATHQTRDDDPMLFYCWPTIPDVGPTLKQHWLKMSYLAVSLMCHFHRVYSLFIQYPDYSYIP